jgi:transcriptional regulator with PAS, ATPase and Fis domain
MMNKRRLLIILSYCLFSGNWVSAAAETTSDQNPQDLLLLATGVMFVFFIVAVSFLQHSRLKHKASQEALDQTRHSLELRVVERTDKLRNLNNKLFEEIARHEATEQQLLETRDYLSKLLNTLPHPVIGTDDKGIITQWNSHIETLLNLRANDTLGKNLETIAPGLKLKGVFEQTLSNHRPTVLKNQCLTGLPQAQRFDLTVSPVTIQSDSGLKHSLVFWLMPTPGQD